jgi:hypothetical protein
MGETLPSTAYEWREPGRDGDVYRSLVSVWFWDRDCPHEGDEPRVCVTCEDREYDFTASSGLSLAQAAELRDALSRWIERGGRS